MLSLRWKNLGSRLEAGRLLPFAWSLAALALFLWYSAPLLSPTRSFLFNAALAAGSIYTFWFLGFRAGRCALDLLAPEAGALERSVIEFGLGTAIVIAAAFGAGMLGLYNRPVAYTAFALALLGPHREFWHSLRERFSLSGGCRHDSWLLTCLVLVGGMKLLASLAPVTAQDALVYHLAVPAQYVAAGRIHYVPGNFFAQFPQNIEMLFTLGLILGDESLAQFYHWMLGAAATLTTAALARALHPRASGLLAAAAFATIPTAALIAGWAYVDLGVVFYSSLSTLCFLRCYQGGRLFWLWLAAVFAGMAAGVKYTAGLQGLMIAGGVLFLCIARRQPAKRSLLLAGGTAAVVGLLVSPWWIKNLVFTGNPLYPFAYSLFGGVDWDSERATLLSLALSQWGGEQSVLSTLLFPWHLTMGGEFFSLEHFDGVIGCVFLAAAPLLVLAVGLSSGHRLVACFMAVESLFWVSTTRQVRFLLPALALASALLAASIPALHEARWPRKAMQAVFRAAIATNVLIIALHFAAHAPLAVVLGLEAKSRYLDREVPGGDYKVFEYIAARLPEEACILFGSLGNPGFLCKRRYHADAFFENHTLARLLREAAGPDDMLKAFTQSGFTHLLFRWQNVFGPEGVKSDIPFADQKKLAGFLNRHGRLLAQLAGTFLYEIGPGLGPGEPGG